MSRSISLLLPTLTILAMVACPALAQVGPASSPAGCQITGQVRYAEGGQPAFQILIRLERYDGGVIDQQYTDRTGRFRFTNLRPLTYNVMIHTSGFQDAQQQVELFTKNSDYLQFSLRPDGSARGASLGPAVIIDVKVPLEARKEFEKGRALLLEEGKPAEGIPHLERAVSVYPNFLEAYLMLGTAYMDSGQLDKAESTLRKAVGLNSKRSEAYFALGEVYRQQKKYAEAEKIALEGLKILERSWQGHFILGRIYYDTGDLPKSGRHVAKTLQLKPDLAEAHLLGGNILLRARNAQDALTEFEEYLRLEPKGKFAPQAREAVAKIRKAMAEHKKK